MWCFARVLGRTAGDLGNVLIVELCRRGSHKWIGLFQLRSRLATTDSKVYPADQGRLNSDEAGFDSCAAQPSICFT